MQFAILVSLCNALCTKVMEKSKVNPKRIKVLFGLLFAVIVLSSCVQELPKVNVSLKYYDKVEEEWLELPSAINSKDYLYGQSFGGTVDNIANYRGFYEYIGPVDDNNPELGRIIERYSFDGKTFSLSPILGKQEPFTGKLKDANTTLYAYYNIERVYENELKYSWKLVDRASFIDGTPNADYTFSDRDISENANLTLLDGVSIMDSNAHFYSLNGSETTAGMEYTYTPLYVGTTQRVNAPTNFTRHGYKFAGWSRSASSNQVAYPPEASFDLSVMDAYVEDNKEKVVLLYAVWTIDTEEGKYYTLNDFSKGINRFSKYFEVRTSDNPSLFKNYPNYNEILVPSKGYTQPLSRSYSNDEKVRHTFDYDFAIAELPITANILNELNAWNDQYNMGYSLPRPTQGGVKNTSLAVVPSSNDSSMETWDAEWNKKGADVDRVNRVFFGSQKSSEENVWEAKNGEESDGQSTNRSDLVVNVSLPQAMIICNALTTYYNFNSDNQSYLNRLTPVYRVTNGNEEIKTIAAAVSLIEEKGPYEPLYNKTKDGTIPTGFRLPSNEEWEYAASVIPQNDWAVRDVYTSENISDKSLYKGSSYPQFQKFTQASGLALSDLSSASEEDNALLKKYCYYGVNSSVGFSINTETSSKEHILSKLSNRANVSGMSGNIAEWTGNTSGETLNTDATLRLFYRRGGSYTSSNDGMAIGNVEGTTFKGHTNSSLPNPDVNTTVIFDTGFRTVRTINE